MGDTATSVYDAILTALTVAGVPAYDGPADDLPTDDDGLVAQAAVVYPRRLRQYARMSGGPSGSGDAVTIHCVGATVRDALAVGDEVDAAIGGLMLSTKGGTLRQTATSGDPVPEPNADPRRVSFALEYSAVTKGDVFVDDPES